jgi:ribosomal-protein-alanine N-acetyltransferase
LPETEDVEIGYLLAKSFWGQGLATEGGHVGIKYGFESLGLKRIIGLVHPENKASQRVLKKLGLNFVDRAEYFGMELLRYWVDKEN